MATKIPYNQDGKIASGYRLYSERDRNVEWRDPEPFSANLAFVEFRRNGGTAAYAVWVDMGGHEYEMSLGHLAELLKRDLFYADGIDDWWEPVKQGAHARIRLLGT